jgi:hypothetical protein
MSHFLTLVLVGGAEPDPARKSHELMMPYFEFDVDNDDEDDEDGEDDEDNPLTKAKCDGFVIGGRYDGAIWGKEQHYNLSPTEFQKRYGFDVIRTDDNIRPISELVDDLVAYAIITPDGKGRGFSSRGFANANDSIKTTTVTLNALGFGRS